MTNYFKIVAILQKRGHKTKIEYAYVPHQWEDNGILSWPPNNCLSLRNDASSIPMKDWTSYKCKVKKSCILEREEAELWEDEYINASSTEAEDE